MDTFATTLFFISILFHLPPGVKAALPDNDSEIPFTLEKGHIIVSATIKGNTHVEMALATGAEHSLIDARLLDKYKLQGSDTGEGTITGSSLDRVVYFVTVPDIRVGDVKVNSLYMRFGAQATSQISQRIGREVFAILGADFFKGRIVQFDFRKRIIRLIAHAPDSAVRNNTNKQGFATLRMQPNSQSGQLPATEEVTLNGVKVKTLFDTGALTVVSLTPSTSKQIGLTPPPDKGPPRADKVASLRFGEIEFTDLPVTLHAKGSDFDRDSNGIGAVVGVALLQNFITTFDFRDGLIILEHI